MRKIMGIKVIAIALASGGCAMGGGTHSSGPKTFDCSGTSVGWDACDKQAAEACSAKGYTVVKRNIDSQTGTAGSSTMKRELVVSCK